MEAGRLTQRVTIQSAGVTRNSIGEEVRSWSDVATVWAEIRPLSARELINAKAAMAQVTTRITIRYRAGLLPSMRVVHGTTVYQITEIIDQGMKHETLECLCFAEVPPT